jgi:excisionase family DNA binding protein
VNLHVPDELLDDLAARVAAKLTEQNPARAQDGYLSVDEAARYLACPASRIYELKAAGKLAHYKDGRRLLFRREDLDAALERRQAA